MSMPKFSIEQANLSRENVINQILSSIAMEDLAISNILDAEGEKLKFVLGTLEGITPTETATIEQVLETNNSIQKLLKTTTKKQRILKAKMSDALSATTMHGPPGPKGSKGDPGIEIKPIKADTYIVLPDDEKHRQDILWVIQPT